VIPPGTRITARNIRVANPRQTLHEARTYTTLTVRGVILCRIPLVFTGWSGEGEAEFAQGPHRPARDATGRYWVQPDQVSNYAKPSPILIAENEMETTG